MAWKTFGIGGSQPSVAVAPLSLLPMASPEDPARKRRIRGEDRFGMLGRNSLRINRMVPSPTITAGAKTDLPTLL